MCFPVKYIGMHLKKNYIIILHVIIWTDSVFSSSGDICQTGNLIRNLQHKRGGKNEAWIDFSTRIKMVFCFHNWSDLLWEKNVLKIKKQILKFWRLRILKNLVHWKNLFKQWNVNAIFVTECFFNFFLEVS